MTPKPYWLHSIRSPTFTDNLQVLLLDWPDPLMLKPINIFLLPDWYARFFIALSKACIQSSYDVLYCFRLNSFILNVLNELSDKFIILYVLGVTAFTLENPNFCNGVRNVEIPISLFSIE